VGRNIIRLSRTRQDSDEAASPALIGLRNRQTRSPLPSLLPFCIRAGSHSGLLLIDICRQLNWRPRGLTLWQTSPEGHIVCWTKTSLTITGRRNRTGILRGELPQSHSFVSS
jgi:hypothetical protein